MKKLFIILFATLFALGCSEDKTDEGTQANGLIAVSTDQMFFLASGDALEGENVLQVTCSDKWRLSGKKTWCRPSATEGESGQTVTFVADPNPDSEPRTITYSFICGSKTSKVVVTQEPSSMLDVSTPTTFDVLAKGGQISLIIKATNDLTYQVAEKDKSWISSNRSRSVQTNFLSFNVAENREFSPRTGSIVFNVEGKELIVTVNQAQVDKVDVPIKEFTVDPEGETITVAYNANVTVVPEIDPAKIDWITLVPNPARGLTPGQFVFKVEKAKATRVGRVPLKSVDGLTEYATLIFSQATAPVVATIPDAKFGAWLVSEGYATEKAGQANKYDLTVKGLGATSLNCSRKGIASLEGIEAFETLTILDCSYNALKSLDLSFPNKIEQLNCEHNDIKVLNVSGCMPFASGGTSTDAKFRPTYNCLEVLHLPDEYSVDFGVAGADRLKGELTGVKSQTFKLIGKKVRKLQCAMTKSLVTVDITECPACLEFRGGTEKTGIKTIYLSQILWDRMLDGTSQTWQKPDNAEFILVK